MCTAFAFIVFFELIREVGTSRGMVFTYVNPAVAVAAGVVFLGEPFTGTIMLSFALILGGSVLATVRRGTAPDRPAPVADTGFDDRPEPGGQRRVTMNFPGVAMFPAGSMARYSTV